MSCAFQSLDALPEGFTCPEGRVKPWGTNHAVLMAKDVIREPFCVINCDDFYNRDAFMVIGKFLADLPEGSQNRYAMVGFRVGNTLSENGTVARGICSKDSDECLTTVVERTEIMRVDGPVCYKDEQGQWVAVDDNTPVSMNMWGFTPDYFTHSEEYGQPQGGVLYPSDGKQANQRRHGNGESARYHEQMVRRDIRRRPPERRRQNTNTCKRRSLSRKTLVRFLGYEVLRLCGCTVFQLDFN